MFTQMCSDPNINALLHWSGQTAFPLLSAALQNRLTAGLCQCNDTYGPLMFIQISTDSAPMHYSYVFPREYHVQQLLVSFDCCSWNEVDMILEASTSKHGTQGDAIDVALSLLHLPSMAISFKSTLQPAV